MGNRSTPSNGRQTFVNDDFNIVNQAISPKHPCCVFSDQQLDANFPVKVMSCSIVRYMLCSGAKMG